MNQLVDHPNSVQYFWPDRPVGHIQDDHIPFLNRGRTQIPHIRSQYRQYSILDDVILCLSARCTHPPPNPLPLPIRVAHVRWQRAEPGSLHHSEPQQDHAGFCSGVPQCQANHPCNPTDFPVKNKTNPAYTLFNAVWTPTICIPPYNPRCEVETHIGWVPTAENSLHREYV